MGYFNNHVFIEQRHLSKRITVWRLSPSHSNHHIYGLQKKNVIHTLALEMSPGTTYCDRHLPCMALTCLKEPTKLWKEPLPRLWSTKESKLRLRTHCLRYSEILSIILSRCSVSICGWNSPRRLHTANSPSRNCTYARSSFCSMAVTASGQIHKEA